MSKTQIKKRLEELRGAIGDGVMRPLNRGQTPDNYRQNLKNLQNLLIH